MICSEKALGPFAATCIAGRRLWYPADGPRLPGQLAQQLLSNPHYVVFSIILTSGQSLTGTSPIDVLEGGLACVETERRLRRFVNDLVFANLKLTWHNWRDHVFPSPPNERVARQTKGLGRSPASIPQQDQPR